MVDPPTQATHPPHHDHGGGGPKMAEWGPATTMVVAVVVVVAFAFRFSSSCGAFVEGLPPDPFPDPPRTPRGPRFLSVWGSEIPTPIRKMHHFDPHTQKNNKK